jgi:hypothetical protein
MFGNKWLIPVVSGVCFCIALISCNHAKQMEENISSHGKSKSHNQGQNCMDCHKKGGEGEGWFYIAGTAYHANEQTPAKDVTVLMFTQPDGQGSPKYTIEGDQLGNFYTTAITGFGAGLYPAIIFNSDTSYMASSITNGACNSCHGVSTPRITVD